MYCRRGENDDFYRKDWNVRAFTVGIHGPHGSGKTSIILAVCQVLKKKHNICVVTNDFCNTVDADFLIEQGALPKEKIRSVEIEGCPMAVMDKDRKVNLKVIRELTKLHQPEVILLESAGNCLAAHFSPELVDYTIMVIDVAGGRNAIKKGIAGNDHCDLLVVNKTDLAKAAEVDMEEFEPEVMMTRADRALLFTSIKHKADMSDIAECIIREKENHVRQIAPECP